MKQNKDWQFYRTPNGNISYFPKCVRCMHTCKQSWQVKMLDCPRFQRTSKLK